MEFIYNDGGRSNYYRATSVGDCAVRAIAIATEEDYKVVYSKLKTLNSGSSCRNGTPKKVSRKYLSEIGWIRLPNISGIGVGIKYHLNDYDLEEFIKKYPRMILQVSKHLTCIIDGKLNDTYDCSRDGERAIYGIWGPKEDYQQMQTKQKRKKFVL